MNSYTEQEVVLPDAKGAGQERICGGQHPQFTCGDRFARSGDFAQTSSRVFDSDWAKDCRKTTSSSPFDYEPTNAFVLIC